ncbi:hypothetical protein [Synechococcus sp. MU1650]|uniref:hypothetical protein n=1 Tax=Synechococcus sp. MU1650 TaxID=2508352 RepID=UPI00351D9D64
MSFSDNFIKKPVLTTVCSTIGVSAGSRSSFFTTCSEALAEALILGSALFRGTTL